MPLLSPLRRVLKSLSSLLFVLGFVPAFLCAPASAREHWTELNIGPFYVATNGDTAPARDTLVQLEQLRWVLGNLLEAKDLPSLWPIRILLLSKPPGVQGVRTLEYAPQGAPAPTTEFVWKNGQYLWVAAPGSPLPLDEVAGLLFVANTPRVPADVESGLKQLFSTLTARGSRVNWGAAPPHPDLAWARMQLFATRFDYSASFHIFLASLRSGSTLAAAERNAFGKSSAVLESEARANLAAGTWPAVPVSGRPLDPKRDFGEHALDPQIADVFLADWTLPDQRSEAEAAYKAAVEAGGAAAGLGYEGLARLAILNKEDPRQYWDDAVRAGSRSAPVYLAAAEGLPAVEALPLFKRAAELNDRWAEPVYRQAQIAANPAEKEALLKTAVKLEPRLTPHWIELAKLQTVAGKGTDAQGSWLRAEMSAPDDTERERVHQLRMSYEQQRLDAAEAARRADRESAHQADEQARQAGADRIRAAEQKANQSLDSAGGDKPAEVVDWNALAAEKKVSGALTKVDCLKNGFRLSVKEKTGRSLQLFLPKEVGAELPCGAPARAGRISLAYRPAVDDELHTIGEVLNLELR